MSVILFAIVVLVAYSLYRWRAARLPSLPGPYGVPLLGYLPFLGRKMNVTLTQLWHTYGDVYQLQVGQRRMVVINGQRAIREALSGSTDAHLAARPAFSAYEAFGAFGEPGYTSQHRQCKRMTLQAMRLFGDERKVEMEQYAAMAVRTFLDRVAAVGRGAPVDPKPLLYWSTWQIMGRICFGADFDADDPEVHEILRTADKFGWATAFGVLYDYLPWTKVFFARQIEE